MAVVFDTLKFANKLKAAGVPDKQAEAEAAALAEVLEVNLKELATKADLEQTKLALRSEIRETETRLEAKIAEVRQDLAAQKADLAWLKWWTGVVAGGIVLQLLKSFGVL